MNPVGLDDAVKLVGAVIGVITAGKVIYDLAVSRKARLRDDYKFAKEFFDTLEKSPRPHPLVVERGYHAIAGDSSLTVKEAEYLLSLENPNSALRDYVLAREYLEHLPESGHSEIRFKRKFSTQWSRRWRRGFYLFLYFVCALMALSPMFFLVDFSANLGAGFLLVVVFGAAFGIPAFNAVKEYGRLYRGEKLVNEQRRHGQLIIKPNRH